jgi:hypothetical protein
MNKNEFRELALNHKASIPAVEELDGLTEADITEVLVEAVAAKHHAWWVETELPRALKDRFPHLKSVVYKVVTEHRDRVAAERRQAKEERRAVLLTEAHTEGARGGTFRVWLGGSGKWQAQKVMSRYSNGKVEHSTMWAWHGHCPKSVPPEEKMAVVKRQLTRQLRGEAPRGPHPRLGGGSEYFIDLIP